MKRLCFFGIAMAMLACSPQDSQLPADITHFTMHDLGTQLVTPLSAKQLAVYNGIPVMDYYRTLLALTTDDVFTIGGQQLKGVHARLAEAEPLFAALADKYPSWGKQASARVSLTITPGRSAMTSAFTALTTAYSSRKGAFAALDLMLTDSVGKPKPKHPETGSLQIATSPMPTFLRNLAAVAALAVVARSHESAGLGLIVNGLEGTQKCGGVAGMGQKIDAVGELMFKAPDGLDHSCSGGFIKGDKTTDYMLTAAHCVSGGSGWRTRGETGLMVQSTGSSSNSHYKPPKNYAETAKGSHTDLGIVEFPAGTARGYMAVAAAAPGGGAVAGMFGFGKTSMESNAADDAGTLRCGSNQINDVSDQIGTLALTGFATTAGATTPAGAGSGIASGDSGGPLVVGRQVAGVASNVAPNGDPNYETAYYVDTSTPESQKFISDATNGNHP